MKTFYNEKTILVTGSTWFKWAWLSFWLNKMWVKVVWYWLEPNTNPDLFSVLNLNNKINQIYWDISDYKKIEDVVE